MSKFRDRLGLGVMWLCALFTAGMIIVIFIFLYSGASDFLAEYSLQDFLFGTRWKPSAGQYGILPMLAGSAVTTLLSLLIAMPLGLGSVLFIHYYAPTGVRKVLDFTVGIMAGIPSVVYGLFGLSVLGPAVRYLFGGTGFSVLTTALLLALMILPTVMTLYGQELQALPSEYYAGALALGESRERSIVKCILPLSSYGIFSSGVLALGRSLGETMAVLMVAGNTAKFPALLTEGVRTLTTNISLEMGYATGQHRAALIACGLVLLVFILILEMVIFWMKRKFVREK